MLSMVNDEGTLIPLQEGNRDISPCPAVIRAGLDIDKIMQNLPETFPSWNYRQGMYY